MFNYPALGSGNGVNQLNGVNSGAEPDINFARSSATPANSNGTAAQNYVQFAIDGVSWVDFPSTDTKKITNLTVADLQAIYADTPNFCTVKGKSYPADNWICYKAKTSLPIDCYVAQSGSGTQGTWKALIIGRECHPELPQQRDVWNLGQPQWSVRERNQLDHGPDFQVLQQRHQQCHLLLLGREVRCRVHGEGNEVHVPRAEGRHDHALGR